MSGMTGMQAPQLLRQHGSHTPRTHPEQHLRLFRNVQEAEPVPEKITSQLSQ